MCLLAKFWEKIKMPKFGTKKCCILVFLGSNLKKTIVIFEINTPEFVNIEILTHAVNFGIGSAFSKGPVSAL